MASRLAKAIADRDSGYVFDSQDLTLSGFMSRWLTFIKGTIREGSWKQYEMVNRVHIEPALGQMKLEKLTAFQVQAFYHKKLESGVSPRRVRYIHATLHKALKQAFRWSLIPRNVTEAVEKPRLNVRNIEPFSQGQVRRLLEAAEGNRLEALYVLAVSTGMRQGELLGLQWKDVDLENGVLRVNRTIFGGVASPPKNKSGKRSIKLSRNALDKLVRHKANQNGSEWVFCTRSGKPIDCTNLTKQSWKPLLKRRTFLTEGSTTSATPAPPCCSAKASIQRWYRCFLVTPPSPLPSTLDLTRSGGHPRVWRRSLREGSPYAQEYRVPLHTGVQGRGGSARALLS